MGVSRNAALAAALACLLLPSAALRAQETGSAAAEPPWTAPQPASYFHDLGPDGEPVFTQVLHWEADPNALEYEVVVRDGSGEELLRERTSAARQEARLVPGFYEYKIVTFNLLGKAEAETGWLPLEVIRAEQPSIVSISPKVIYMDALDGRVAISGSKLQPGGRISLNGIGLGGKNFAGNEVSRRGAEEALVAFPDEAYQPGLYSITVENPGGLSASLPDALRIRFQRPVDLLVSVGYSPFLDLYDEWLTANWPGIFNPLGLDAGLDLFFVKASWGFVGLEAAAQARRMTGGEANAVITSDYLLAGLSALYKYRFTRRVHALLRLGGGLALSRHGFDYDGFAGPKLESADPFARAGFAVQLFTTFKLFAELGLDWSSVFLLSHQDGGITPSLRVGYLVY